jgi:tetratricopeptide (TPR) repeat protein
VYVNLGLALNEQGRREEAMAACRMAIELKPDYATPHNNLGFVLAGKGRLDEAIAECREALRLKPDYPEAHNNLGNALGDKGQLDGAIAECRQALRLKPDSPETHCNLGVALMRKGQFRQAVEELRTGHQLGSRNPSWRYPSAQWLRRAETLAALEARLPAFLEGKDRPADNQQRLDLAMMCVLKKRPRSAAGLYADAFAADPQLLDDMGHCYNAACAATLAGYGQGQDTEGLDARERAHLRQQAFDWLRDHRAAWARRLADGKPQSRAPCGTGSRMPTWPACSRSGSWPPCPPKSAWRGRSSGPT